MQRTLSLRPPYVVLGRALSALVILAACISGAGAAADTSGRPAPIANTESGVVRGRMVATGYEFLGLPYAAPPTGALRWRAPKPPAGWTGIREATEFGPSCPQPPDPPFAPAGQVSEDCLRLNVYTPTLDKSPDRRRPVLVWIHGGGLVLDAARSYDPTQLAAEGTVVVTINYRLGALGFLAHPALASVPGGPSGNYGLMDQQAALGWVRRNIVRFGGDPGNVTIAGESAGGLSVLAHLVAPTSRGLFQKAIVQSGSFALTQQPLSNAEAFGQAFASAAGCPSQTAQCLRDLPADALVKNFPTFAIPGVVDGAVLTESIGAALAAGRFTPVPILNGMNHDEERIFVVTGTTVSQGTFVGLAANPVTDANYSMNVKMALGVDDARAAAIAAEYPTASYASPTVAFSTLVADASFACTALQTDRWTSSRAPTFAYEFSDDAAVPRYAALGVATHTSELPYLFALPHAPIQVPLTPDQQQLASAMRAAWARFAASGNPSTAAVPWPSVDNAGRGLLLVTPQPQVDAAFASRHHCSFWVGG